MNGGKAATVKMGKCAWIKFQMQQTNMLHILKIINQNIKVKEQQGLGEVRLHTEKTKQQAERHREAERSRKVGDNASLCICYCAVSWRRKMCEVTMKDMFHLLFSTKQGKTSNKKKTYYLIKGHSSYVRAAEEDT